MTAAQGVNKKTAVVKQSGLGSLGSSGSQWMRRTSSIMQGDRDTFKSAEILSHQQDTGITYGMKKVSGKLDGVLSPATYKLLLASLLRKDFVAGVTTSAVATIGVAPTSGFMGTLTATVINWLTLGFKVGDVVQASGFTTTGVSMNTNNALILSLTSTVLTFYLLNETVPPTKVAGDTVTVAVVGKKTLAPLTGQTNDYFTIEEQYTDTANYELFGDMRASTATLTFPTTGDATAAFTFLGLSRKLGVTATLTSPAIETSTPVLSSVQAAVFVNGGVSASATGATITIDGGMGAAIGVLGSNNGIDIPRGVIKVSGTVTGIFSDTVIQTLFDTETPTGLVVAVTADQTPNSAFMCCSLSRIKFTGDVPDDGEGKVISRTYPWTAEININGGPTLANDNTIMSIQDSAA